MISASLRWRVQRFDEMSKQELYAILAAREAVFVVEQDCPYQDVDGKDDRAVHVSGWSEPAGLVAYARILPPGVRFAEPAIGRVLTTGEMRGGGLGRELMARAVAATQDHFPGWPIRISAQQYLEAFYREFGFETVRGPYPEDGIPHLEMLRPAQSGTSRAG